MGDHRKAAIRAPCAGPPPPRAPALLLGRPKTYPAETLRPILKPIGFTAFPPCGARLHALLPEWLPAYEADQRRLAADVREALLAASARTLDRLVAPAARELTPPRRHPAGEPPAPEHPDPRRLDRGGPGWLELDTVCPRPTHASQPETQPIPMPSP